jgi:plastocyanin
MKHIVGALLFVLMLVAGACSSSSKTAQTSPSPSLSNSTTGALSFEVQADQATPNGKQFQFSAYYPATIKARPGDSITFVNSGDIAPHTITFGVKTDRSNSPSPVIPGVGDNPAVFFNCVAPQAPTSSLTKCPTTSSLNNAAYDGSGYWNGFLVPAPAPQGLHRVTLKLAATIAPGTYHFLCILHPPMVGTLQVVASDSQRQSPAQVDAAKRSAASAALAQANAIPNPSVAANEVASGWSGGAVAVNSYYPQTIDVKAGTTVTWKAFSPFEPHTVTFGASTSGSEDQKLLSPSGVKSGGSYSGGVANSGIFGAPGGPFPSAPFSLTFTKAGSYHFVCILHHGMEGTVKVS